MAAIIQLDHHVSNLIAAGEVVERPASVVKELVENAIDAGATAVTVETRKGGMALIRVTDNGVGMHPTDLKTAFLRHATSKLRHESDLSNIGTLGFRGEALAAISAVSRLNVTTRRKEASIGAMLHLEGGVPNEVEEIGAPEGTTMEVMDLFYNTPARLKFMRRDSAETAAVNGLMQHLALSHPQISFRYQKDGKEALLTPGDGNSLSSVYAALGREFAKNLIEIYGTSAEIKVDGFVTKPLQCRGSRSMQTFFVNGRFIKSQLLTAALEEAYRNQLMKGKFPGCVIFVTLPVTAVDVNVHPAKTQVKFAREHDVFDAVYHTVLDTLDRHSEVVTPKPAVAPIQQKSNFFQTMDASTFRQSTQSYAEPKPRLATGWQVERKVQTPVADSYPSQSCYKTNLGQTHNLKLDTGVANVSAPKPENPAIPSRQIEPAPKKSVVNNQTLPPAIPQNEPVTGIKPKTNAQEALELPGQENLLPSEKTPWRIVGEVLKTYIICEDGQSAMWLIDKHAAHERILFDRLHEHPVPPMRQRLLVPVTVELDREENELLLEHLPLLSEYGFDCQDFGDGAIIIHEVPADIDVADATNALEDFAQRLRATGKSPADRREALLHTIACKAAVKAGMDNDERELRALVDRVQAGEIQYCPHGRPVAVKMTRYELEKMFRRA